VSSLSAGIIAALAATLLVSSCSGPSHDNAAPSTHADEPVVTGEPAGDNAADVTFAGTVIAQDQQAIDLAALVPDRSTNPNVVAFATTSASARRSEIAILKVLQVQWNSNQDSQGGQRDEATTKGMIDQATIAKLQSSHGAAFETLWLQSMVGLDKASFEMANAETANGKNVDAVELAKQIVKARQAEIDHVTKMLGA
jgi:uncharacterized protein (DUF305 family)